MSKEFSLNDFQHIGPAVKKSLFNHDLQNLYYFTRISKYWDIIIGDQLFIKTSPKNLQKKTLIINTEDPSYAHHLKYFEKNILDLIASPEICGEGIVTKLIFRVGEVPDKKTILKNEPEVKATRKKPMAAKSPIVIQTGQKINDIKLKNTFENFMAKIINLKKNKNDS